ncbi:ABC transporter ATP-binding protein [bacterium]|nr:ABC transporter ATP-binding protein [bacterium]
MKDILVEVKNLTKIYGKGELAVKALDNINLKIRRGDFIVVMGPSGSGKTTLLNMIGALDKPSSGEVIIENINISKIKESELYKIRREKIGFIFQNYYLIPTLNVLQNVLVPVFPLKKKESNFKKRAKKLLSEVGLEGKEQRKPFQLSGGEQQRVAIARALILDPVLILADEPTGNLDTKMGMEIIQLMRKLNQEKEKTFLIVTHDQRIAKFSNKVIQLEDGKIKTPLSTSYKT